MNSVFLLIIGGIAIPTGIVSLLKPHPNFKKCRLHLLLLNLLLLNLTRIFRLCFADRIGGLQYGKGNEIYKFEKIKRAKRKALADFPDRSLLDFGIGENDSMADIKVREKMATEVNRPENRGYMGQRDRRIQRRGIPVHETRVPSGTGSGQTNQSLYRVARQRCPCCLPVLSIQVISQ